MVQTAAAGSRDLRPIEKEVDGVLSKFQVTYLRPIVPLCASTLGTGQGRGVSNVAPLGSEATP